MSKAEGKKIGIKFNLPINEIPLIPTSAASDTYSKPIGTVTQGGQYSSFVGANAFDGNVGTYWYYINTLPIWIMIELAEAKTIFGFRMYVDAYPPNAVNLYGSNNGIDFDLIIQTTNTSTVGWKEHTFNPTSEYKYFKWVINSKYGAYLRIHEFELLYGDIKYSSGMEDAFIITGQEYLYTDGPDYNGALVNKTYVVDLVQIHPTEINSILLDTATFKNVQGNIIINYNQVLGTLAGIGGDVASFEGTFTPTDLEEKPSGVGTHEYIEVSVGASIEFKNITKLSAYEPAEYIETRISGIIELINIEDINP